MKIFNLVVLVLTLIICCAQEPNDTYYLQKLKSVLDLNYPDNFQIIMYENTKGPDDFEKFQLKYSKDDFENIILQIDTASLSFIERYNIYSYTIGNYRNGEAVMFYMDRQIVQYTYINE